MRDWIEVQKSKGLSFSTWKRPNLNQRCAAQLWEKLDQGVEVRPSDLSHCTECVSTLKWLQRRKEIRITVEGFIKAVQP